MRRRTVVDGRRCPARSSSHGVEQAACRRFWRLTVVEPQSAERLVEAPAVHQPHPRLPTMSIFHSVSTRCGKPIAACLRLARPDGAKMARSVESVPGTLAELAADGAAIGIEVVNQSPDRRSRMQRGPAGQPVPDRHVCHGWHGRPVRVHSRMASVVGLVRHGARPGASTRSAPGTSRSRTPRSLSHLPSPAPPRRKRRLMAGQGAPSRRSAATHHNAADRLTTQERVRLRSHDRQLPATRRALRHHRYVRQRRQHRIPPTSCGNRALRLRRLSQPPRHSVAMQACTCRNLGNRVPGLVVLQ